MNDEKQWSDEPRYDDHCDVCGEESDACVCDPNEDEPPIIWWEPDNVGTNFSLDEYRRQKGELL